MSKKHQLGKLAAECAARRSPLMRFKTGAAYVRDDYLISMGWSHRGAQLTQTRWSTHAELHAAQRARWSRDLEGATAYICTLTKSGNMTSGRPCNESCYPLLRRLGFVSVVYSISNGKWIEEYV
jgi:deoxycytidylate deaminase